MITIRTLTADDAPAADLVLNSAFNAQNRWQELQHYLALQPDGWLLAVDSTPGNRATEAVGIGGAVDFGGAAYIGLVGVVQAAQRRGIGRQVVERLLAWLDARACPVALLDASDAGAPLYTQLGFVDDGQTIIYQHDDCALRPPVSELVTAVGPADVAALAAFDAPIYGGDRTRLFSQLATRLAGRAFVARDTQGVVVGYLFAQPAMIGPWAASSAAVAEALLAAALPLAYEGQPRVLVPSQNAAASGLFLSYGFSPRRSLRHMRRGGSQHPGQRGLLYAQVSLAIG